MRSNSKHTRRQNLLFLVLLKKWLYTCNWKHENRWQSLMSWLGLHDYERNDYHNYYFFINIEIKTIYVRYNMLLYFLFYTNSMLRRPVPNKTLKICHLLLYTFVLPRGADTNLRHSLHVIYLISIIPSETHYSH